MSFHDRAVDQVQAVARFRCQGVENSLPDAASGPAVKAIVRCRVGSIALRQIAPRHPRAQHVKYCIHDLSIVSPSALAASRHQRLERSPFIIAQVKSHDPPPSTVNHVRSNYSMIYLGTDPSSRNTSGSGWNRSSDSQRNNGDRSRPRNVGLREKTSVKASKEGQIYVFLK